MEISALHSQIAVFTQEDNGMYFALGLAHAARQLAISLDSQAPPRQWVASAPGSGPQPSLPQAGVPASTQPDNLVSFLLGLLSFSLYYAETLEAFNAGPSGDPPATSLPGEDEPPALIRQLLR